jgi:hypothetical protein
MKRTIITLTSDFCVQSNGVAMMEAAALEINPKAQVINLMHGLPSFNLFYAARTMETTNYMQVGYHVCVVDPGVGTKRKPIIIQTKRGDYLIGPDNGVLIPGARFLKGIKKVVEITNKQYMKKPVSPIFHGRDIFTPAAAYLSKGIDIGKFGKKINPKNLAKAPYEEAILEEDKIHAKIISINKFGSLHLNITHEAWDKFKAKINDLFVLFFGDEELKANFVTTFGEVYKGEPLIIEDEYGRIEVALNQDSFKERYKVKIGDDFVIEKR